MIGHDVLAISRTSGSRAPPGSIVAVGDAVEQGGIVTTPLVPTRDPVAGSITLDDAPIQLSAFTSDRGEDRAFERIARPSRRR